MKYLIRILVQTLAITPLLRRAGFPACRFRGLSSPLTSRTPSLATLESAATGRLESLPYMHWPLVLVAIVGLVLSVAPLRAGVLKIELPPETTTFKPGPGAEIANAHCLTCHSVEYVPIQPPSASAFWSAEVKKMREKYGAQIPDELTTPLLNYLVKTYGLSTNGEIATTSAVLSATEPTSSKPGSVEKFAALYGCLSCHKLDSKLVGPSYKDVAAKYRNDPAALEKISAQIHNGGSGKWGSVVMPPFATMSDAQAKELANWIMAQGGTPK
ncbi:MAG: cytochrome C552 [Verrucomicrobia bacterium]|nr:MAG: cytochrome C552 [Verrucomicrobiota bacterium]